MEIIKKQKLDPDEKEMVFNLWNSEYPVSLSFQAMSDMDNYLDTLPGLTFYLLKNDKNKTEGWAMTFGREDEIWFAITIAKNVQGQGKGTFLLARLKTDNDVINGWVIDHENDYKPNGEIYRSPLQFYKKNDFEVFPGIRLEIPVLSALKISWKKNK
ncbi:MAG TPA: hypothetical protein VIJ57_03320 [Hanamia sp.]